MDIAVLHGPNLDRLGKRRPDKYGTTTLAEIVTSIEVRAGELGVRVRQKQSNSEGTLIDWLHDCQDELSAIIVNPAGLTPYGRSLYDALSDTELPIAVVHLSSFFRYEKQHRPTGAALDLFADLSTCYVAGFAARGYLLALEQMVAIAAPNGHGKPAHPLATQPR